MQEKKTKILNADHTNKQLTIPIIVDPNIIEVKFNEITQMTESEHKFEKLKLQLLQSDNDDDDDVDQNNNEWSPNNLKPKKLNEALKDYFELDNQQLQSQNHCKEMILALQQQKKIKQRQKNILKQVLKDQKFNQQKQKELQENNQIIYLDNEIINSIIQKTFSLCDQDQDGLINRQEAKIQIKKQIIHAQYDNRIFISLFDKLDLDGQISQQELEQLIYKFRSEFQSSYCHIF